MPDFWMCLTQNIIYKVFVQITEQLSKQRRIQNTVKHLRWRVLQKSLKMERLR